METEKKGRDNNKDAELPTAKHELLLFNPRRIPV